MRVHLQIHDAIAFLESVVDEKISSSACDEHGDLLLSPLCPTGWHVPNHERITLQKSKPQPAIAVILGRLEDLTKNLPSQDDAKLVVEIAHRSLATDRLKAEHYAQLVLPTA